MFNSNLICEKYFRRIGRSVKVVKEDGTELTTHAVLQQAWRKNQSRFDLEKSEIGNVEKNYCHYIGPASFDIRSLSKKDIVICDNKQYYFLKTDRVEVGGKTQFYIGVLKRIWEGDYNAFI